MRRALFLTAYNRPDYLRDSLVSWESVQGLEGWTVLATIEPSPLQSAVSDIIRSFSDRMGIDIELTINPERYGVLRHPWVVFERLFSEGFDFVVRTEDDIVVSDDILKFFEWSSEHFEHDPEIATVNAFNTMTSDPTQPDVVQRSRQFSPLVWGTWRDRWEQVISPTWDHDYSTFNDYPGHQSGWDWNLNTRVLPQRGLRCAVPCAPRSDHIGVVGTHGTAENFFRNPHFQQFWGSPTFREADIT